MSRLKLLPSKQYDSYNKSQPITLHKHFVKIKKDKIDFGYSIKSSAVYSSMIEGNTIDLDTYYKYYTSGMNTKSKSYKEISHLEKAYLFAQDHVLNQKNVLNAHKLMCNDSDVEKKYRGKYRDKIVTVNKNGYEVVYTGALPGIVQEEMDRLFYDIAILRKRELSISKIFYFASLIHLSFVAIHPFADGNGRTARLLEKWFLVAKLGNNAWGINSEKLYQKRSKSYHQNINKIGDNYNNINYDYAIPFLKMLPMSLRVK